ncbi:MULTISPECIES: divalent-cation tolerance protein CutA [unclassified Polynucleobacter]|uniref:divalent-cation tolerance protein CutA n=1 Tax=unclassified Polynucleobacter TaxID=2640945 RepID=UPI0008C141C9|nr:MULTISPECIES: divalent-cation tolerance protein CutA [unclassified Polynucleobacter]OHC09006.1 MAG: cytochrome C biogenesis protein [Polynucleobacter sp. GWA2_45_21]HBK43425.1 divalent-cation tolerance protein CutA [Polynucleobacter sp.]
MTLDKPTELLIVVTTFASLEDAKKIAYLLIEGRLAACVQIQEGVHSIYRWEGKICEANEVLLSAKTVADKWVDISNFIKSHHPYDLPEVIAYAPEKYEAHYGKWVESEVK